QLRQTQKDASLKAGATDLTLFLCLSSIQKYPDVCSSQQRNYPWPHSGIAARRGRTPQESPPETALKYGVQAAAPLRDFMGALSRPGINIMAELKPASPSRGMLREPFDPVALAESLEAGGAAALSVLTEPEFFRGSLKNLRDA